MDIQQLDKMCADALISRLKDEYYAAMFYKAGKQYADLNSYDIMAKYCDTEFHDELAHAKRIEEYLNGWDIEFSVGQVGASFAVTSVSDFLQKKYEIEYNLLMAYSDDYKRLSDYPDVQEFISTYLKIQSDSVIDSANQLRKIKGIAGEFELRMLEKELFN